MLPVFDAKLPQSRPCLHWTGVGEVRATLLLHNGLTHNMDMGTVTVHTAEAAAGGATATEPTFVGEAVLLPLKPGELALLAFAKETRVSVAKEAKALQHPPHKVEFLDSEGALCEPARAARIRKVSRSTIETTYTVTNRTGEQQSLFIDHRAAEPRAANPYTLAVGRDLLDPRFPSPIVYRISVPVGPDRAAPAVAVLLESRDVHDAAPITSLAKEEIAKLQRTGLLSAADVADIERVLARVESLKRAEVALKAICAKLPRIDGTKHSVDVAGIVDAVEALDAVVIRHLTV